MSETITRDGASTAESDGRQRAAGPGPFALVLAWAAHDRARIGESIVLTSPGVFGRGEALPGDREARCVLCRRRPFGASIGAALGDPFLSRAQLRLAPDANGVRVERIGKRPLIVRGVEVENAVVREGETIEVQGRVILLCVRCTDMREPAYPAFLFGGPDGHGIVGESNAAWRLRERIAFVAKHDDHVLLTGPSGAGKEHVARALHALSQRGKKLIVSRNAATLPAGVIDAELFGNAANYPNAGMAERVGLVGQADGSTLFLDEIGEMSAELQAHLLRLLDGGEYHRLGESKARRADLRVICATNRPLEELKHDLIARLGMRIEVPGLDARREDVTLIARALLKRLAAEDRSLESFFEQGEPRISIGLATAMLSRPLPGHVRELRTLLWDAIAESTGAEIDAPRPKAPEPAPARTWSVDEIRAALEKHDGVRDRAWRELGMKNRFVLLRLLEKYGIE